MEEKDLIIEQQNEQIAYLRKKLKAYESIRHKLLSRHRNIAWNSHYVEKECAEIYRNAFLVYKDPFGFLDDPIDLNKEIIIK